MTLLNVAVNIFLNYQQVLGKVFLTFLCIILKNGQTYFKNLVMFKIFKVC